MTERISLLWSCDLGVFLFAIIIGLVVYVYLRRATFPEIVAVLVGVLFFVVVVASTNFLRVCA